MKFKSQRYEKLFGSEKTFQGSALEKAECFGVSNIMIKSVDCMLQAKTSSTTIRSFKIDRNTRLSLSLEKTFDKRCGCFSTAENTFRRLSSGFEVLFETPRKKRRDERKRRTAD